MLLHITWQRQRIELLQSDPDLIFVNYKLWMNKTWYFQTIESQSLDENWRYIYDDFHENENKDEFSTAKFKYYFSVKYWECLRRITSSFSLISSFLF